MNTTKALPDLPDPISAYFAADLVDGAAVAHCFTENATVKDEGQVHTGTAGIARWKTEASRKYHYTCKPIGCKQEGGRTVVTATLTGNFPGSPVDLRFFFELAGDKLASLEIAP